MSSSFSWLHSPWHDPHQPSMRQGPPHHAPHSPYLAALVTSSGQISAPARLRAHAPLPRPCVATSKRHLLRICARAEAARTCSYTAVAHALRARGPHSAHCCVQSPIVWTTCIEHTILPLCNRTAVAHALRAIRASPFVRRVGAKICIDAAASGSIRRDGISQGVSGLHRFHAAVTVCFALSWRIGHQLLTCETCAAIPSTTPALAIRESVKA